jgi:3-isopropylmalate/(R)-2-methylmalate dehydratase small subunit
MGAGIKAVVAESFSRLQFRNGINRGLPLITCSGIRAKVSTGHQLEIELDSGRVSNLTTGEEAAGAPLPGFVREIAEAGGLIAYAQKAMKNGLL